MARKRKSVNTKDVRRCYTHEFKEEAVQMLLDGHSATSVGVRLGLSGTNMLYRWKQQRVQQAGVVAGSLETRVKEIEVELRRVERERDVLKKRWLFSAATSSRRLSHDRGHRPGRRGSDHGSMCFSPSLTISVLFMETS